MTHEAIYWIDNCRRSEVPGEGLLQKKLVKTRWLAYSLILSQA
jgi:hypothetical protein